MRILVTGADGRLGKQLCLNLQSHHAVTPVDVGSMDITDLQQVNQTFEAVRPELVIHCAALTGVDYCAEHPEEALKINALGTQTVALECQQHDAALLYVSTNEVFDGKTWREYQEYDSPHPANPYAYSKWVGEQIVRDLVRQHYLVRTSWLFSQDGHNFVQIMLQLAAEGKPLRVVTNEVSCPTYNLDLAEAICRLIETKRYGIYHLTNEGYTSRYQFARQLLDLAGYDQTPIEPIALAEYQRPSRPPEYAILRNFMAAQLGIRLRPWQDALAAFVAAEQSR
ncbi:MAG TPA: dTDP-4-dehydrorhamnose reductase [Aggregatilineaceae bacterium]|nr:dTDP-4-dehydrorhamnose reductase [Aggregatilineaceae bacterium]